MNSARYTLSCLLLIASLSAIALELIPRSAIAQPSQIMPIPARQKLVQINRMANFDDELLRLTNLERKKLGLAPLKLSAQLKQAAQFHAKDMATNGFFSHTGLNGSNIGDRAKSSEYRYAAVGENLAAGRATPEGTIRQWMNSAGHRANILNNKFTEIGFGYANAPNSRYRHYWVQVLGRPQ
ncbi:MAG: hypothetical protein AUK48_06740 [Oscillatoriales cyanobacterium CG2_30_44_21]|nr:MAG: hypothetical protein AUK48_06740 [Oscillatoriales cyanobacterium CG2_30_44_21]